MTGTIYQTGVIAEASPEAIFATFRILPGQESGFMAALKQFPAQLEKIQQLYPTANIHAVAAIGSVAWDRLVPEKRPAELVGFPASNDGISAPDTPADLLLHVRSERRDLTYLCTKRLVAQLLDYVQLIEEISCFRYLESRDLTGFVDGTENPEGKQRFEVALVGDEDPDFAGGSYIHLQKYVHRLSDWERLDIKQQEDIIGRTKADNIEYDSDKKPLTAHIKRASVKDENGHSLEILRHSLPYATLNEAGLMFASYCRTPRNFSLMLKSMIEGDQQGHTDHLMRFTQAVTGQSYFAPSNTWLQQL